MMREESPRIPPPSLEVSGSDNTSGNCLEYLMRVISRG